VIEDKIDQIIFLEKIWHASFLFENYTYGRRIHLNYNFREGILELSNIY